VVHCTYNDDRGGNREDYVEPESPLKIL